MKIIILAAGIGSRLGNPFPKPLTPLKNGKSIMQRQMDSITTYFDINDITTVVGFKKNLIMEQFPEVNYVYNPFFDTTNTSKSLLRALKKHRGNSILWFNGDVVFDPQLVSLLQNEMNNNQSFVSVNTQSVSDEEVKYTLKDGFVESLSKEVKNGLGEAVGINFIAAKDLDVFINQLENCDDNDYFEKGLEMAIAINQLQLKVVDISAYNCIEVDFKEDLLNANKII
ncbi:MAG: phosphocholine cytidylyltransferase family protein [Flavobacteriaceae bacterium]|jgi:choline kinase|nr:phosphocholine cytidylyltransferase family protein [Flavobacteriaceae bacterium]MDG1327918.1 phosphocholine cytidylyltransferase family protein [Flavobacteriaceae bacterium]MDG1790889.1 phosphocholine cytidylyltransferase family protein [Flavobacteriaceae bacterium]MDG2446772.1 phosphocholine cytidylyltransferase family protein [Flavobacteriaceae bacterium]|tara:strand:- start:930 stop:1610 length:681 start_codon:yes stop_codon:yes gene_type:complete